MVRERGAGRRQPRGDAHDGQCQASTEFELLRFMMHNSKRVLSKAILDRVWSYDFGRSNIVELYISYLRKRSTTVASHDSRCAARLCAQAGPLAVRNWSLRLRLLVGQVVVLAPLCVESPQQQKRRRCVVSVANNQCGGTSYRSRC